MEKWRFLRDYIDRNSNFTTFVRWVWNPPEAKVKPLLGGRLPHPRELVEKVAAPPALGVRPPKIAPRIRHFCVCPAHPLRFQHPNIVLSLHLARGVSVTSASVVYLIIRAYGCHTLLYPTEYSPRNSLLLPITTRNTELEPLQRSRVSITAQILRLQMNLDLR